MQKMKRKISRNNPNYPSPIRNSFPAAEIRSSEKQFKAAKADEPKTSEYAFFKKFKKDAGRRPQSRALNLDEEIGPKFLRSSECSNIERSSTIKNSFKDLKLPVEHVTCVNPDSFLSPVVKVDFKSASSDFGGTHSTRKSMEILTRRPEGTQNQHEDLFSAKRQKLHQWVTDITFPEIEQLCSKGYDFVSVLLSRLFPDIKEEYSFKITKSGQVESNVKSKLFPSPYSNSHSNKLHQMSIRNFTEDECDRYLENGISTCRLDRSRERALANSESPTCHGHTTFLDYNLWETRHKLGGGRKNTISWFEHDSVFSSPSRNHGYLPLSHVKELDNFQYPDWSSVEREKNPLLLEWDPQDVKNERTSVLTSQNRELITYHPTPSTSCSNNYDWNLDGFGPLDASRLSVSSVTCKYPPHFYPLPPSPSTSYCKHEFESNLIEDHTKDIVADLNLYPLALSHMPYNLYPTEEFNHNTTYKGSTTLLSPVNHHWSSSKISSEWHHDPGSEAHVSSDLDYYSELNCLSTKNFSNKHYSVDSTLGFHPKGDMLSQFLNEEKYENWLEFDGLSHIGVLNRMRKEMAGICDLSSFYLQISMDKQETLPLLHDKSSRDEIEGEIYQDDCEVKYI